MTKSLFSDLERGKALDAVLPAQPLMIVAVDRAESHHALGRARRAQVVRLERLAVAALCGAREVGGGGVIARRRRGDREEALKTTTKQNKALASFIKLQKQKKGLPPFRAGGGEKGRTHGA